MSRQSPKTLESLFEAAVSLRSADERMAFLDESCAGDAELRRTVEALLRSHEQAGSFLQDPPGAGVEAALGAGLARAFDEDEAIVIGRAGHSVLKQIGETIDVPRVLLRESQAEHADPIQRPNSPELPAQQDDSRYQLQGEIARGGMGAIIKGRDTDLGRDLAIKVLLEEHKAKPEVIQRFVEEAQIGGQLQHPGIAPVYELGQFPDKRPFFSMKLIKGKTLSKLLGARKHAAEDRGRFLGIFEHVCQTMAYAHSRGVIHRDLKPANIMVGAFGEVQVMDWGLAKVLPAGGVADEKEAQDTQMRQSIIQTLRSVGSDAAGTFDSVGSQTQMGSVMGTPAYMPPEQALGEIDNLDERSDVFGLGALLCEILTGQAPYVANDGKDVFRLASRGKLEGCFERLDACGADAELIALARHCLELEPADRPRDAGELADKVTGYLESVETKLRRTEVERAAEAARAEEAVNTVAAADAKVRAERRARRLQLSLATGLILVATIGGAAAALTANSQSQLRKEAIAEKAKAETDARQNQQLALAAQADAIRENLPQRALLLASKSWQMANEVGDPPPRLALEAIHATLAQCGGKAVLTLPLRDGPLVGDVRIKPDDGVYEGVFDNTFKRVDLRTLEPRVAIPLASPDSWGRPISNTHQWLAEGTLDGDIYIYNLESLSPEEPEKKWRAHDSAVQHVYIDEGRTRLVTLAERECKIWSLDRLPHLDADAYDAVIELPFERPELTMDSTGTLLAFSEEHGTQALIFHVEIGQQPDQDQTLTIPKRRDLCRPVFSPDGRYLCVSALQDTTNTVWDILRFDLEDEHVQDSSEVLGSHVRGAFDMFYTSDGKLITCSSDCTAQVFDDSRPHGVVLRGHSDAVWTAAASSSGRYLATGSGDHTIRLWDLDEADPNWTVQVLRGHEDDVVRLVFSEDENFLYSISDDSTVRAWEIGGSNPLTTWRKLAGSVSGSYMCTPQVQATPQVCANGRLLVATRVGISTRDGQPRMWNVDENDFHGKEIDLPQAATPTQAGASTIISNDGRWVFELWGKRLVRVDGEPKIHVLPIISEVELLKAWFDPKSQYLLTFDMHGTIQRWDLTADDPTTNPRLIYKLLTKKKYLGWYDYFANDSALSPDGDWIFAAGGKESVYRWDLRIDDPSTSRQTFRIAKPGPLQLRISPDGSLLVAYSQGPDGNSPSLTFWTFEDGVPGREPIRELVLPQPMLTGFTFAPNSRYLAVNLGSDVWVWDVPSVAKGDTKGPYKLQEHSSKVFSFAFSSRGTLLATSEQTGDILVWDLERDDPEHAIQRLAAHKTPCPGLRFYDDDTRLLSFGYDLMLRSWDLKPKRVINLAHEVAGRDLTDEELKRFDLRPNDTR